MASIGSLIALGVAPDGASPWVQFVPFALVLGIFYFIILLPMKRKQQKVEQFLGGLLGSSMRLLLFQVGAWDPLVFGGTIAVLSSTGLVASLVPALRAAAVDPLRALRHD